MAIVSGWAYHDVTLRTKYCTKAPNQRMREICTWPEFVALAAPHCAIQVMNGDADWIIDRDNDGSAWVGTRAVLEETAKVYRTLNASGRINVWFEKGGGHRPYFAYTNALEWIHQHLGTPDWTLDQIRAFPTVNSGQWCDANGIELERLYGTELHQRGATLPDFGLRPNRREQLSCLNSTETGTPQFTVEGWLKQIEKR